MNASSTTLFAPAAPLWQRLASALAGLQLRRPASAAQAAARDAAAVRALADRYRHSDPGFASDLYAAAARYESSLADRT
jgi:hypothetical protein